ncbi:hypothetical protein BGZ96_002192 [Linnemannia gamsii]|uniref:Uncharacterized protein n=1 Tax=Linnemannia gamsii TaxID=64522 RepID=A0ABQ7K9N8_9FUNG|nr:hypothetical protein BGZ96_002192 [Linnemannia gamsii]
MATTSPSSSEGTGEAGETGGAASSSGMNQDLPPIPSTLQPQSQLQHQQQHVIRKKTSFAAKLRKVFNNSKALPRTPQDAASSTVSQQYQQEDIISLVSGDDLFGSRHAAAAAGGAEGGGVTTHAQAVALMDQQQHRGSVSSASSVDTIDVHPHGNNTFLNRRDSNQTETPTTSPEATPCGSPTDMSTLNAVMSVAPNQQPGGSGVVVVVGPFPSAEPREMDPDNTQHRHPLSGSESSSSSSTHDIEINVSALSVGMPQVVVNLPTNQTAADLASALQPPPLPAKTTTPTRTVKKRLSFASLSSFFSPRNANSSNSATAQQEARAKQQRASSVPHVENPLVTVGRQIAGFQRRHSLNDLHDNKAAGASKISRVGVNPWEKDPNTPLCSTTAAAVVGQGSAATIIAASSANPTTQQGVPKPAKKLSLNSVFNKGLRKKKKNAAANAAKLESPLPAKPLRSALANRAKMTPSGSDPATQQQQAPKVHLVHRASVVVAGRRRSASIRSQNSSHRRHHRHSHHQHQHHHGHHHHGHNNHHHTDPFARFAEANHALATLSRRTSDGQTGNALGRLQQEQQQYQAGEFSSSQEEFEFCASPSTYDSTSGGLPPLDTKGLKYHHNNQSQEGLPISPTRPTTGDNGSPLDPSSSTTFSTPLTPRVLPNATAKLGADSEQLRQTPDALPATFNRSQYTQQKSALSTLSPSSSCCSYSSSSTSSDGVERSSFRSTSDDVESYSSSCSSKQEPSVALESVAATMTSSAGSVSGSASESVAGSSFSRRDSSDHGAVFNPLLPASAARVSVNRIAMESQQKSHNSHGNGCDSSSNDGCVIRSTDSGAVLHDQHNNNNSLTGAGGEESASTMSTSSTEVSSSTFSSSTSTSSPTKKCATVTIMNTVAEDVASEEEVMMQAQLAYIQQQQQQYLVQQQQQQQYQHQLHQQQQMQEEHHHHHHHTTITTLTLTTIIPTTTTLIPITPTISKQATTQFLQNHTTINHTITRTHPSSPRAHLANSNSRLRNP